MIFIDTNIAIALRDGDPATREGIGALDIIPVVSVVTRIELENGVNKEPAVAARRRALLDRFLETICVEMFTPADIRAYGEIVYEFGYSRRLTLDRLIAAQVLSRDAVLITRNGADFRKIDGLRLDVWASQEPSRYARA
jgi:tRNA(fMet)-specific endonuclease VapC